MNEDEEDDKALRAEIERNLEGIADSVAFVNLYSEGMKAIQDDWRPAMQLGIAILLEKPIIVAVLGGRTPPPKLLEIADAVVYGEDPQALAQGIKEATDRLAPL